jgi:hypothetical protein
MDRNDIRSIISQIRSYHPATVFQKDGYGRIRLVVPGAQVTEEQHNLFSCYYEAIKWYLTTPPREQGNCYRDHTIRWVCTPSGIWLCACYYTAQAEIARKEPIALPQKSSQPKYRNYWTPERIAQ